MLLKGSRDVSELPSQRSERGEDGSLHVSLGDVGCRRCGDGDVATVSSRGGSEVEGAELVVPVVVALMDAPGCLPRIRCRHTLEK